MEIPWDGSDIISWDDKSFDFPRKLGYCSATPYRTVHCDKDITLAWHGEYRRYFSFARNALPQAFRAHTRLEAGQDCLQTLKHIHLLNHRHVPDYEIIHAFSKVLQSMITNNFFWNTWYAWMIFVAVTCVIPQTIYINAWTALVHKCR